MTRSKSTIMSEPKDTDVKKTTARKPPVKAPSVDFYPKEGDARVLKALKLYPELERVFIGKKGGIFKDDTFTSKLDETAKLYTNPFYVKK